MNLSAAKAFSLLCRLVSLKQTHKQQEVEMKINETKRKLNRDNKRRFNEVVHSFFLLLIIWFRLNCMATLLMLLQRVSGLMQQPFKMLNLFVLLQAFFSYYYDYFQKRHEIKYSMRSPSRSLSLFLSDKHLPSVKTSEREKTFSFSFQKVNSLNKGYVLSLQLCHSILLAEYVLEDQIEISSTIFARR